jgi:hypothetical protein
MPVYGFKQPKKGQKAKVNIHAQEREETESAVKVSMEDIGETEDGPKASAKSE